MPYFIAIFFSSRHVQVNNDSAIDFYQKFGFEIVETREQYYKRIEPAGAHVLEKNLRNAPVAAAVAAAAAAADATASSQIANADLSTTNSLSNGNGTESQQLKATKASS